MDFNIDLKAMNSEGKNIYEECNLKNNEIEINLNGVAKGLYFLKVYTKEKVLFKSISYTIVNGLPRNKIGESFNLKNLI